MADSAGAPKPTSSVKLVLLGEAAVGKSSLVLRFVNNDFQENKEPTIGAAFLTQKCALPNRTIKFEIWDTAGQERFASLAPMYYRNAQAALVVYDLTKASSLTKAQHWVAELQRQASPGIVIALVGNKYDLTHAASRGESGGGVGATSSTARRSSAVKSKRSSNGEENGNKDEQDDIEGTNKDGSDALGVDGVGDNDDDVDDDDEDEQSDDPRKVSTKQAKTYADAEGLLFFETSAKTGMNVTEVFSAIASAIPETQLNKGTGRGGAGAGGRGAGGGSGGGAESRIDLGSRDTGAGKDGCAC